MTFSCDRINRNAEVLSRIRVGVATTWKEKHYIHANIIKYDLPLHQKSKLIQ